MRLGWIGFGEAASGIARGLASAGLATMTAYDVDTTGGPTRAAAIGVRFEESLAALVAQCDLVISATPGAVCESVAGQAAPHLKPGQIYADLATVAPRTKATSARLVEQHGGLFVDAAVMDPVPLHLHRVPILAAGSGSNGFAEALRPYGMNIEIIWGPPGAASAIKLVRSIFMKGLAAITIETLVAAQRLDVTRPVMESLQSTLTAPFEALANRFVTGALAHAARRRHEMEAVEDLLKDARLESCMTPAIGAFLERMMAAGGRAGDFDSALRTAGELLSTTPAAGRRS